MNNIMPQKLSSNNSMDDLIVLEEYEGHTIKRGCHAGEIRNNYRLVGKNDEKFYEMNTENGQSFYFSLESLPKVLKIRDNNMDFVPTWFLTKVGYISCSVPGASNLYLHAWLMNHYGHGKGQMSVDHINQNKLDNRLKNLRIVNQSVQNQNRGKKARPKNAQPLPKELGIIKLPIHITYNKELLKSGSYRDFFRIEETHPKLTKSLSSTKSTDISILEKLEEIKQLLYNLDNDISTNKKLPKCVRSAVDNRSKQCKLDLIYERKSTKKESMKMKINLKKSFKENLEELKDNVMKKYKYDINIDDAYEDKNLPEILKYINLPNYTSYNVEIDPETNNKYEFFKIEHHPLLKYINEFEIRGIKTLGIDLLIKYKQIIQILEDLNKEFSKNIENNKITVITEYIHATIDCNNKPILIFCDLNTRYRMEHIIDNKISLYDNFMILKQSIFTKYNIQINISNISEIFNCDNCNEYYFSNSEYNKIQNIECECTPELVFNGDRCECINGKIVCNDCFETSNKNYVCENCNRTMCSACITYHDDIILCLFCREKCNECNICNVFCMEKNLQKCDKCKDYLCNICVANTTCKFCCDEINDRCKCDHIVKKNR